jgi:hypothetical protein
MIRASEVMAILRSLTRHLSRIPSRYLAITAGLSRAHILDVPVIAVPSREAVVCAKAWSSVPARLVLHPRDGWSA